MCEKGGRCAGPMVSPGSGLEARFSKVPKLFGHISGHIIRLVCSKGRRLEARNFAVILIYIPFTTYEKTSFTELVGRSFTNGFSGLLRNKPLAGDIVSCSWARHFTLTVPSPPRCIRYRRIYCRG